MPLRKAKSKRQTTRHRAKVSRKVREHRRQQTKDAKVKIHKKPRKDPGIPSALPDKEAFVNAMMEEREKEKRQRQILIRNNDLSSLAAMAAQKNASFEEDAQMKDVGEDGHDLEEGRFYDHSKKAFYREFRNVVNMADVILAVLDARDPLGCRIPMLEQMISESGGRKRLVLVLNKIDLVPRDVVKKWLDYLRRELPCIAFKASTQSQRSHLGSLKAGVENAGALSSSECLGGDTLIELLKNYCRSLDIKTSIRVGVVGYPNVGKSSLINSLKRSKVCKVGPTPGVTTASQEIHLDKNIKLLDCPGIVFASPSSRDEMAQLFLRNCLKVEQIDDPIAPIELILQKASVDQLMMLYALPRFHNTQEFLTLLAKQRGKLKKGGIPNLEEAARGVLFDWNQGKIPFYTIPPVQSTSSVNVVSAEIVNEWAPAFDFDKIAKLEVETVLSNIMEIIPNSSSIASENIPQLIIASGVEDKGKGAGSSKSSIRYDEVMKEAEESLNPQLNQSRQKALKNAKKIAQKKANRQMAVDGDDDYDFSTDYNN